MTFFHNLNKKLSQLAEKQDLHESTVAESEKWIQKAVNPAHKGDLHKALHVAQGEKIPKAKIEKATHSKNPKLRHMAQFAKNVAHEDIEQEGNAFTGKLAATPKGGKFKVGNKEFKDTSSIEEGQCSKCAPAPCSCNEGNAFTGKLNSTAKGDKFKLGKKEFTDTSSIEEGFKEMDAWMASREKEKGTGKFDKKERTLPGGMKATTYTRRHEDDEENNDDSKSGQAEKYANPKKKGRPKSAAPKDSERVTKGSHKFKMVNGKRVKKTDEDLDSDSVMMTRPSNMSSESMDRNEYDAEGDMVKGDMHTVIRHATELEKHLRDQENLPTWVIEKIGQIKGMMTSVSDYILSQHERGAEQATGQEGIRMGEGWRGGMHGEPDVVKTRTPKNANAKVEAWEGLMAIAERGAGMQPKVQAYLKKIARTLKPEELELDEEKVEAGKREFFDRLAPAAKKAAKVIKAMAKNRTPVEEESTDKEDTRAERAGKKVAKDIEHDEGNKAKGDNKAEKAGKRVTKDIEYDDKKDKKEKKNDKEEKVEETTVSGSVATATTGSKSSKGGMSFGKGVYESLDKQFKQALTESIQVKSSMEECGDGMDRGITITADGDEASKLMMLLKLAGLEGCPRCGKAPCGCDSLEENKPDWPTNTETLLAQPELRTYSGGLNGPKSTGQTTVPVVASQMRRQTSMEESVELERSLFKTWKNYKG
jgi:hypothetical protein